MTSQLHNQGQSIWLDNITRTLLSTGTKDPDASDTLYVEALVAPNTITTLPEKTLLAFAEHGVLSSTLVAEGRETSVELAHFADEGIDIDALALQLQHLGTESFVRSWNKLLQRISEKSLPRSTTIQDTAL